MSLPTADDLFHGPRHTRENRERGTAAREIGRAPERGQDRAPEVAPTTQPAGQPAAPSAAQPAAETTETPAETAARKSSGRVRHDEKMTVYVTADELLDIEHARLSLRRHQGLAVDRGRLVREAIAIALADLEANGDDSVLVQRLIGR